MANTNKKDRVFDFSFLDYYLMAYAKGRDIRIWI